MKIKLLLLSMLAACGATSSAVYAGAMGPVGTSSSFTPFVSAEGLYSWPNIDGLTTTITTVNVGSSQITNRGWGGRIAAGLMHSMTDRFAYSGELGWGYYGHTVMGLDYVPPLTTTEIASGLGQQAGNMDRWGFDALVGLLYTQPKYDLYVKGGALFQNMRFVITGMNLGGSGTVAGVGGTLPEVLPEIKLGGAYHITDKLAATVSWMYAFGGAFSYATTYDTNTTTTPAHVSNITASFQNSSMNVVMFGLEYRFA